MADSARARQILQQIAEERAKGVRQGRILSLVLLSMFSVTAYSVYWRVTHFDTAKLESSIERQASAQVWPMVAKSMDKIAADAVPALSAALTNEAADFMPKVEAQLGAESGTFQTHVHDKMKASLDEHFATAFKDQGPALKARFPQFAKNPEKYDALMAKLEARCQTWAQGQLDTTFAQHIAVLQSINASVQALATQAAANPTAKGSSPKSMDDVMSLFLDIMNSRLDGKG